MTMKHGTFRVGDRVAVGRGFRIPKDNHISFDSDADHCHPPFPIGGSVECNCTLTILGFEDVEGEKMAVARLDRPRQPWGRCAPIGQVFMIPVSQMQEWKDAEERKAAHEERRTALEAKYRK